MRKRMKSAVVMILSLALTGAVLTGCGENRQLSQDAQRDISMNASEATGQDSVVEKTEMDEADKTTQASKESQGEKTQQTSEQYEDNFAVDSEAAKEYAEKIKDAAAQRDLEALADLTSFPVYVGLPDVGVVETREDFLALGAEAVFTEGLLESIEKADIENLQPSMAGFSISDGGSANINFGVVDGALAISGINY